MKIGCRWHPPWLILGFNPPRSLSFVGTLNLAAKIQPRDLSRVCPIATMNLSRTLSPSPNPSRYLPSAIQTNHTSHGKRMALHRRTINRHHDNVSQHDHNYSRCKRYPDKASTRTKKIRKRPQLANLRI